jgi:thiol-disulfide isomerase/thioredoxin
MRIKLVLFCCCIALSACMLYAQTKKGSVKLSGTLNGFSNQVEVEDLSELKYLLPPTAERMIIPDMAGHFSISFPLASPNYFRIGRNILWLSPGDEIEVFINYRDARLSTFKGKGSDANTFLRHTPFPKAGSYMEAGSNAQPAPQGTIDYIISAGTYRMKQLDSVNNVPAEFRRLEKARVKADIINSLQGGQISFYRPRKIQKDSVAMKQYGDEYAKLIQPLVEEYSKGFVDASLMKIAVYRDLAEGLVKQPGKPSDIRQIKDWLTASELVNSMKKLSDKKLLAGYREKVNAIQTSAYRSALAQSLSGLLKFGKGDTAVDFAVMDANGNKIMLSSLKGKLIYIDLWATWCGPCMEEMPHFEVLKQKYASNPNLAFVSLSIDDDIPAWKASITKRNAGGYQWLINRNKLDAYNIVSIPRILMVDKNFAVVDMNAPAPSSKQLPAIIDGLLMQ